MGGGVFLSDWKPPAITSGFFFFQIYLTLGFCLHFQENRQQQQQVQILRNEVDNLRSDNVKLYEKIRFLQSYPSSKVMIQIKLLIVYYSQVGVDSAEWSRQSEILYIVES